MLVETRPPPQLELGSHLLDFIFMNLGPAKEALKGSFPSTFPVKHLGGSQEEIFGQSMTDCKKGLDLDLDKPPMPEEPLPSLSTEDSPDPYVCDVCKGAGVLFCPHDKRVFCRKCDISVHQQGSHRHHRRYLFGDCMQEEERNRLFASLSGPTLQQQEGALFGGLAANHILQRCSGAMGSMEDIMGLTNEDIAAPIFETVEKSRHGGNPAQPLAREGLQLKRQRSSRLPDLCLPGEDSLDGNEDLMDMDWLTPLVEGSYNLEDPTVGRAQEALLEEPPLAANATWSWPEGLQQKSPNVSVGRPRSRRPRAVQNQRLWLASELEEDDDEDTEPRRKPRRKAKKPKRRTALPRLGSEDRGCCRMQVVGEGGVGNREGMAVENGVGAPRRGLGEGLNRGRALCEYSMLRPGGMVRIGIKFQGENIQVAAGSNFGDDVGEGGNGLLLKKAPEKKARGRKPGKGRAKESGDGAVQLRCMHCSTTKTPQWRAGPNGPKTLCNACGVRYKSGRLVPEYRPAGSPSFSSSLQGQANIHCKDVKLKGAALGDAVLGD